MSVTLVSFYIDIKEIEPNHHKHHKLDEYVYAGQLLINIPIKKVLFIDSGIVDKFIKNDYTVIVPITLINFPLYMDYYQRCKNGDIDVLTPDKGKDTALFHLLQLSKTKFVEDAIKLDPFKTDIFAWIDFGIRKIFKSDEEMITSVSSISQQMIHVESDSILMPSCWLLNINDDSEFQRILWYFCGGFFMGFKEELLKFAILVSCEAMYIMEVEKKLTFEVNVWFRIWRSISRYPDRHTGKYKIKFKTYLADHNAKLFKF
jgi:hypothetical protein